jgi:hypothetical protein
MADERVIDTTVLQKANAPITSQPRERRKFLRRLRLLGSLREGNLAVLFSRKLLAEYRRQITQPRNDFVRLFFEILDDPGRAVYNWAWWSGRERDGAQRCRFPQEDYHVLRTAIRPNGSTIVTEEERMLRTDECLHRVFRVHVRDV